MRYLFRLTRWFLSRWWRRWPVVAIGIGIFVLVDPHHHWIWELTAYALPSRSEIDRWIRKRGRHAR